MAVNSLERLEKIKNETDDSLTNIVSLNSNDLRLSLCRWIDKCDDCVHVSLHVLGYIKLKCLNCEKSEKEKFSNAVDKISLLGFQIDKNFCREKLKELKREMKHWIEHDATEENIKQLKYQLLGSGVLLSMYFSDKIEQETKSSS